jgi:hypothetical protein
MRGIQLLRDTTEAFNRYQWGAGGLTADRYDRLGGLLGPANLACEMLQKTSYLTIYRQAVLKARLCTNLEYLTLTMAALRHANDLFVEAERKGLIKAANQASREE